MKLPHAAGIFIKYCLSAALVYIFRAVLCIYSLQQLLYYLTLYCTVSLLSNVQTCDTATAQHSLYSHHCYCYIVCAEKSNNRLFSFCPTHHIYTELDIACLSLFIIYIDQIIYRKTTGDEQYITDDVNIYWHIYRVVVP